MISSYFALRDPKFCNFTKKLSVFLAIYFLIMTCIVFVCNFLFIKDDEKSSEEDYLVNYVALDMAFEDLTKKSL